MIETIVFYIAAGAVVLAVITFFLFKLIIHVKTKKAMKDGVITEEEQAEIDAVKDVQDTVNYGLDFVRNVMLKMESVEKFMDTYAKATGQKVGELKKSEVMEKIETYCATNGIPFDSDIVSKLVEDLIVFSKNVNKKSN